MLIKKIIKLIAILRVPEWRVALFHHRVAAGIEHADILRLLKRCKTVIDIGANRGQFSLAVKALSSAKLIAFEPLPGPAEIFRSIFSGDNSVTLHAAAIGPRVMQCQMHVSAHDDSSSLLPISVLQSKIFPGTAEISTTVVNVAPLDVFIKTEDILAPALLKLDVQGFEYEALCGCESLLSRFEFVYCECSFLELYSGQKLASDVIDWLSFRGFRLKGVFNTAYDDHGRSVQADFLFERDDLDRVK